MDDSHTLAHPRDREGESYPPDMQVFPRNADLCTRCVIKVRLRRGPAQDLKLLVEDLATGVEGAAKSISMGDVSDEAVFWVRLLV